MTVEPKVIHKEYWEVGVHTYGYELGLVYKSHYVKFIYPAAFYGNPKAVKLKLYKTLVTAERAITKFKRENPERPLTDEQKRKLTERNTINEKYLKEHGYR